MDISVIICTYNRASALRRTLETFCTLEFPRPLRWELLVVDNHSTDATRSICEEFKERLPIRYFFEPVLGQSRARNCGIHVAAAELLAFTDDDVDVDRHWLVQLHDAAQRHSEVCFFGGPIIPRWESPPPRWLEKHARGMLSPVVCHLHWGHEERVINKIEHSLLFGASMAFRKKAFDVAGMFDENLGLKGNEPVRGDETTMMRGLLRQGCAGLYVPGAVVHHRISPHRMTEAYVREWFKGLGMTKVRSNEIRWSNPCFGVPLRYWYQVAGFALKYVATRWTCPSRVWLRAEIKMARSWGVICELRRRNASGA